MSRLVDQNVMVQGWILLTASHRVMASLVILAKVVEAKVSTRDSSMHTGLQPSVINGNISLFIINAIPETSYKYVRYYLNDLE